VTEDEDVLNFTVNFIEDLDRQVFESWPLSVH